MFSSLPGRVVWSESPPVSICIRVHEMPDRLTYTVADACSALGIRRTRLYEIMPQLDVRRLGGRTLITAGSLRAYVEGLPKAEMRPSPRRHAPQPDAPRAG